MHHSFQRLSVISVGSVFALIGGIALAAVIISADRPAEAQIFSRDSAGGGFSGGKGQLGQGGQRQPPDINRIMQLDRNGDGLLAPDEMPERARDRLGRADTDGDGMVSRTELETVFERMKQMRAQGGFQGGFQAGKPPGGFKPADPAAPPAATGSSPAPTPYVPGAATNPSDDAPILPSE